MSTLAYPKNGGAFLLQRITDLHASIADLIDELVKRDQTIAEQAAQIAKLTPPAAAYCALTADDKAQLTRVIRDAWEESGWKIGAANVTDALLVASVAVEALERWQKHNAPDRNSA